ADPHGAGGRLRAARPVSAPKTASGAAVCGGSAQARNDNATTEKAKPVSPWAKPATGRPRRDDERGRKRISHRPPGLSLAPGLRSDYSIAPRRARGGRPSDPLSRERRVVLHDGGRARSHGACRRSDGDFFPVFRQNWPKTGKVERLRLNFLRKRL